MDEHRPIRLPLFAFGVLLVAAGAVMAAWGLCLASTLFLGRDVRGLQGLVLLPGSALLLVLGLMAVRVARRP